MDRFSPPTGPHGPYHFGVPSQLINIHFPHGPNQRTSEPWFWYITQQVPRYFQYIGSQLGGVGWQSGPYLPIIRILPIDTQHLVPTSLVGFASVEEAITRTNNGEPISLQAWGRFRFTPGKPGKRFWDICGLKKPEFTDIRGVPTQFKGSRGKDIRPAIKELVKTWLANWTYGVQIFNNATANVQGSGDYSDVSGTSHYALPYPPPGLPLLDYILRQNEWYFGPLPPTYIFRVGHAFFWKQAYSFDMNIAQLDADEWDMSVWPPQNTKNPLYKRPPSRVSGDFGGYHPLQPDFPDGPPGIV